MKLWLEAGWYWGEPWQIGIKFFEYLKDNYFTFIEIQIAKYIISLYLRFDFSDTH